MANNLGWLAVSLANRNAAQLGVSQLMAAVVAYLAYSIIYS